MQNLYEIKFPMPFIFINRFDKKYINSSENRYFVQQHANIITNKFLF